MEKAGRTSWKVEDPRVPLRRIPYEDEFTSTEWARLSNGLIPECMEDKWFVFAEEGTILLHRSWTGEFVYKVTVSLTDDAARVVSAEREDWGDVLPEDDVYHGKLVRFLLRGLVLHQDVLFPLPAGHAPDDGLYQHHIAGTGFPEEGREERAESRWVRLARRLGFR